ncbi:hypothetical protein [Sphingomonas fennica]|uniref:Uncharacterized protein n=1 Tax=Edaphosphingomonas fennica TaxID=114404 RepID=A0A2T4HXL2_9SPHN|nr:hypothetical protein [Sphingomonas fennica]PTD20437.1 hypothetical protein CV103_11405 [Sphingomonas fennica]
MSQRRASFTQDDVKRAVRGALKGGAQLASLAIAPTGDITIKFAGGESATGDEDDLDDRLDRFAAR